MIVFTTARLIVRHLQVEDFDAFHALCNAPEVVQYMDSGRPLTPEETRKWITISQRNYQQHGYGCFAITDRQSGVLLGFGGLVHAHPGADVEIIYALKQSAWGQGLATEFASGMLETGFQRWNLPSIDASIDPRNTASLRVVEKLGMTLVRSGVDENGIPTNYYTLARPS